MVRSGFVAGLVRSIQASIGFCAQGWRGRAGNPRRAGEQAAQRYWLMKVTGMTIVAPPPSGGANCALETRAATQEMTVPERPPPPEGLAPRTSPLGPILAV